MNKKEKRLAIGGFVFLAFLLLCTVINLFSGHIGAAISGLGAGIFFCAISFVAYKKAKKRHSTVQ